MCRIEPAWRVLMKERSSLRASHSMSWPTFSSSVMRERRSATRSSTLRAGLRYGGGAGGDANERIAAQTARIAGTQIRIVDLRTLLFYYRTPGCASPAQVASDKIVNDGQQSCNGAQERP